MQHCPLLGRVKVQQPLQVIMVSTMTSFQGKRLTLGSKSQSTNHFSTWSESQAPHNLPQEKQHQKRMKAYRAVGHSLRLSLPGRLAGPPSAGRTLLRSLTNLFIPLSSCIKWPSKPAKHFYPHFSEGTCKSGFARGQTNWLQTRNWEPARVIPSATPPSRAGAGCIARNRKLKWLL